MTASPETLFKVLPKVQDFESFVKLLLGDALRWPVPDDVQEPEDLTYDWSQQDLRAQGLDRYLADGYVLQLQNLIPQQPWGIFLIEFATPEVFGHGKGMTGVLRKILRGLVSSARRQSNLPSWEREDLLFICTCGWKHYAFVHFTQPEEKGRVARLSTFGWSAEAARRTRTVVTHNLPHLEWPENTHDHDSWRGAWSHAWDKEALTKQFYEVFAGNEKKNRRGVYQVLRDDLRKLNKLTDAVAGEHSLLILNRLLFLYFIQKKGWLAQDTEFLRNGFKTYASRPKDTDFYREKGDPKTLPYTTGFLSGLFAHLSIEDHPDSRFQGVPFLNGGLFQPDDGDADLKISNSTFGVIFDELLDRFNFTVTEDTPLDVEVAIDPEMLGKIFKCLALRQEQGQGPLAEAEGELDKKLSKQKLTGSYYTPRTIVHFMCQEALKEHLRSAWREAEPKAADKQVDEALTRLLEMPYPDPPTAADRQSLQDLVSRPLADTLRAALITIRVVDPAVGSGAFVVGMLHEIVRLRALLDLHLDGPDKLIARNYVHDLKKEIIEQSLFGVDIQEQAVRLCELRLWLSLVVDFELPEEAASDPKVQTRHIPTLPNLSYRIVQGDSLLERLFGHVIQLDTLTQQDVRAKEVIRELKNEKATFFALRDPMEKRRRELVILEKQVRLAEILIEMKTRFMSERVEEEQDFLGGSKSKKVLKAEQEQRERIELWRSLKDKVHDAGARVRALLQESRLPGHGDLQQLRRDYFETKKHPTFFWQIDFAEVFEEKGGFDVVIANPPYIRQELLKDLQPLLKPLYTDVAEKNVDAYVYFIELGRRCAREGGTLCYITSSTWTKSEQGEALRKHLSKKTTLQQYIDFGHLQVFEGVTTYPSILILRKHLPPSKHKIQGKIISSLDAATLLSQLRDEGMELNQEDMPNILLVEDQGPRRLKEKLSRAGVPLHKLLVAPIYRGVTTGYNKAFVVNGETRDALVAADEKSLHLIKPYIEGKNLGPWSADWKNRWIIFLRQGSTRITEYPAVYQYLKGYKRRLEPRPSDYNLEESGPWPGRKPGSYKWFEIQDTVAYYEWFERPKIFSTKVSRRMCFSYDDSGMYSSNTSYILPVRPEDKWLVSILNSSIMELLARSVFVVKAGGFFEIQPKGLNQLPIAQPPAAERKRLSALAEALSEKDCPNRLTLEAELNDRVAHLYGLTAEEKKIVDGILPSSQGDDSDDQGDDE